MRTIKFRGKSKLNSEWVYVDLVQCMSDDIKIVNSNRPKEISYRIIDIQSETVGQFTGLCDKDGKEIYEEDIIHLKWDDYDKDFGIVKWHNDGYFYVDDNFGKFPKDNASPIGNFFDFTSRDFEGIEVSIIGNIHDNPELLKNNDWQ